MELPELVRDRLGEEDAQAGLALADDDLLCLTPTRTLLYRADGLLSDERVTAYPHDVERLELSEGRRKTKFHFEYVDDEQSLTVPTGATRDTLALLLEGILRTERVLDAEESVVEAFRFSELTLVVADDRIVKHVGSAVWDGECEAFDYEALTGIDFEQARVATEVVLYVDGRPERIKTPNDDARLVERALERALTEYFEVTSLSQLQSQFQSAADETDSASGRSDEYPFDSAIRPLGEGPEARAAPDDTVGVEPVEDTDELDASNGTEPVGDGDEARNSTATIPDAESAATATAGDEGDTRPAVGDEDGTQSAVSDEGESRSDESGTETTAAELERIETRLDELTTAVDKQNQLLRKHHAAIKQLVEELQSER
ncbi:DUF7115 domain-containing protein [Halapricum desulfuricans]|uniref:DUF7115 domain-containing protein n=1 Tax=Halapricum desulfuricans TaxID=2841257 RepID=A0A897N145_9EURY|nr:hypothetical protein [Halapricum desulfuricans]QSG04839.1 Uncharacterized protein HSR121_0484 [Halapricum desulfuricans]